MTNTLPHTALSDAPSELTSTFACQLSTIRQRLAHLRRTPGRTAAIERRYLLQREAAWQLGHLLLRRTAGNDAADLVEILEVNARHGGPAGEAFAAMAAMIAIHSLWSAALQAPEGHPARGGLHS